MHFIAKDTETGGFYPAIHALLSIGACCSWSAETFRVYITLDSQPGKIVEPGAAAVNGYSLEEWERRGAVPIKKAMELYVAWIEGRKEERRKAKFVCHNLEFDRSHLRDAERITGIEIPHRHDWRCSQLKFGELMDKGALKVGSSGLERLGELSNFWGVGLRPATHDSLHDAQACLHGYLWLLEMDRREESTLRQLYTDSLTARRALEDLNPDAKDSVRLNWLLNLIFEKGTNGLSEVKWTNPAELDPLEEDDLFFDRAAIDRAMQDTLIGKGGV